LKAIVQIWNGLKQKNYLQQAFAGCISRIENLNKTIEYLTEAFQLRLEKNLPKKIITESLELLPNHRECESLEEFNQFISSNTKDALQIEVVFLHRRILGNDQNDYHDVLHNYGARLAFNHQYHDCFRWWFYEFDLKQKFNITIQSKYLQHFVTLFMQMKFTDQINIDIDDLLEMFKIMNNILILDNNSKDLDSNLIIILHLISLVARIIYSENLEEKQELSIDHRRQLYKSILCITRHQYKTVKTSSSLLHLCTNSSTESSSSSIR